MNIIPVIDILNGKVVHGVKGKREEYKPIESELVDSSNPLEIAFAFKNKLNLNKIYIADLNSIKDNGENFDIIGDIKDKLKMNIILDMGVKNTEDLKKDIISKIDEIIIGTETLSNLKVIKNAMKLKGKNNVIVSIDMSNMKIISSIEEFSSPEKTIRNLSDMGIEKFILLDLKKVGSMEGISENMKKLISNISDLNLNLITGGGIRCVDDISFLNDLGIDSVLIATSLHRKKITKKDLSEIVG